MVYFESNSRPVGIIITALLKDCASLSVSYLGIVGKYA